jgi:hypothetical protein
MTLGHEEDSKNLASHWEIRMCEDHNVYSLF